MDSNKKNSNKWIIPKSHAQIHSFMASRRDNIFGRILCIAGRRRCASVTPIYIFLYVYDNCDNDELIGKVSVQRPKFFSNLKVCSQTHQNISSSLSDEMELRFKSALFFLKRYFLKNTNRVYTFFSFFTLYPCKVIPFTIKILWAAKHGRRYYYRVIWDLGLVRWSMSFVGAIRPIFDRFLFERKYVYFRISWWEERSNKRVIIIRIIRNHQESSKIIN